MPDSRRFRILFAASEVVGFAKTGGLADVAGALPRALAQRGHDVSIILPLYSAIRRGKHILETTGIEFTIPVGERTYTGRLIRTTLPKSTVPVYLVEQPELFERDDQAHGHGLYQFSTPDGRKHDYPDNAQRYIFFCRAVIENIARTESPPDILHCNDWQTGLLPVYLRVSQQLSRIKSLFTIHNIAYQGNFPAETMAFTGLPQQLFNHEQLEFYGQLNFMKAGCVFADALNTVSPRYAQEIQTSEFGCGLEGVLATRHNVLSGIVNGVDYGEWDPSIDRHLPVHYSVETVFDLKPTCKQVLQRELRLPERADVPVLGIVARLVEQKGISLIMQSAIELLSRDVQLVILGEGDANVHRWLCELQTIRRQRVGLKIGFDEGLAHLVEAGADMFLMPSRYEPSGLNQLYSLRYGTVPIVRSVGGLADTIADCSPANLAAGTATGFLFESYTSQAFMDAIRRALNCWHREPHIWRQLVRTGMTQDWSWNRSAGEYERVYERLTV